MCDVDFPFNLMKKPTIVFGTAPYFLVENNSIFDFILWPNE